MSDLLVRVPEDLADSPARRALARVIVTLFCGALAATALVDTLAPLPRPTLIGGEAEQDATMRANARFADGTYAQLVEHDLRVHSRARLVLAAPWALLLYRAQGASNADVIVGRDGWLYFKPWMLAPDEPDELIARRGANVIAALERRLADSGLRFVAAPIPRKAQVYPEFFPERLAARVELEPAIVRALEERGVVTADLAQAFAQQRRRTLYGKRALHWCNEAQLVAAETICRRAGIWKEPSERETTLQLGDWAIPETTLLEWLGLSLEMAQRVAVDERSRTWIPYRANGLVATLKPALKRCDAAIYGSSFIAGTNIAGYITHVSDVPTWNAGASGTDPVTALRNFLREHKARQVPPLAIVELHTPTFWQDPPFAETLQLCAERPPRATSPLFDVEPCELSPKLRAGPATLAAEFELLAQLPRGRLVHSGDGIACVALAGEVREGNVALELRVDELGFVVNIEPGEFDIVLPLIASATSSGGFSLRGRARDPTALPTLAITRSSTVVALDLERAVPLIADHPNRDARGWSQHCTAHPRASISAHAGLVIELGRTFTPPAELIAEVRSLDSSAPRLRWSCGGAAAGATLVFSLSALRERELESLTLGATDPEPANCVARARLLAPFAPGH